MELTQSPTHEVEEEKKRNAQSPREKTRPSGTAMAGRMSAKMYTKEKRNTLATQQTREEKIKKTKQNTTSWSAAVGRHTKLARASAMD